MLTTVESGVDLGLVATAFALGLRHGIDWDHIAAITDLASYPDNRRRSLLLASTYAIGHALVVVMLGTVAVVAGDVLPDSIDTFMGRIVGATLVVLGAYVLWGLARDGSSFRMRSRWLLIGALFRNAARRVRREVVVIEHDHDHDHDGVHGHEHVALDASRPEQFAHAAPQRSNVRTRHHHEHVHIGALPADPFAQPGRLAAFGIGVLHGVGAETPTQVLLFIAAAGAGGVLAGEVVLIAFTIGLLASNSVIAIGASTGFLRAGQGSKAYLVVAATTGALSLVLGTLYVLGIDALPPIVSG